jgi:hypothetical protein
MMRLPAHPIPTRCPFCGRANDAATAAVAPDTMPKDGDFSLCIGCGEWGTFESGAPGGVRKPTTAEYDEINGDLTMRAARWAWVKAMEDEARSS